MGKKVIIWTVKKKLRGWYEQSCLGCMPGGHYSDGGITNFSWGEQYASSYLECDILELAMYTFLLESHLLSGSGIK